VASNRLGFNQFLKSASGEIQLILDTNVVIAFFDEDHRQHDLVKDFLSKLDEKCNPLFYSTVTVKSEFLDFRRRWYLTDGLLDLVDEVSIGRNLITAARVIINYFYLKLK
jgi:predicted nucleic acid-binding protein